MCCCDKPTINGQIGYKWQPEDKPIIRPVDPPPLEDGDVLLYDEPGRCGGIDSHSYHYRLVRNGGLMLLVRNGSGDYRIRLSLYHQQREVFDRLDSNDRYWLFNALYHAYSDGERRGREATARIWIDAAIGKRIKTRKLRGKDLTRVWIEKE